MFGNHIKLPLFNGNGLEDLEKHWFLCESIWTVQQVQNEVIMKEQIIITLRGHALKWYMNLSIVPARIVQKTIDQIQVGLIDKLRKPKSEPQCITKIK